MIWNEAAKIANRSQLAAGLTVRTRRQLITRSL